MHFLSCVYLFRLTSAHNIDADCRRNECNAVCVDSGIATDSNNILFSPLLLNANESALNRLICHSIDTSIVMLPLHMAEKCQREIHVHSSIICFTSFQLIHRLFEVVFHFHRLHCTNDNIYITCVREKLKRLWLGTCAGPLKDSKIDGR